MRFLIFKEVEGKGRTTVHKQMFEHVGASNLVGCKTEECGFRHACSLRTGFFEKLKSLFEEEGLGR